MMNSPFFRHYMNSPSHFTCGPSARGIPVQNVRTTTAPSPKVVSIPVRFVGSEPNRSESALKIQKVVRGFLVRKSVKKIASIKRDVVEIEKRISKKETVELIRNDSREKLRVNEALMNLLLKLDSVRGVYSGIRDCRKGLIKKAIGLQDAVDAISSVEESCDQTPITSDDAPESCDQTPITSDDAPESCDQTPITPGDAPESCDQTPITPGDASAIKQAEYEQYSPDCAEIEDDQTTEPQIPEGSTQTSSECDVMSEALDNCTTQMQEEPVDQTHEDILESDQGTVHSISEKSESDTFKTLQASNEGHDGNFGAVKQKETIAAENPNVVSSYGAVIMEEKKRSEELLEKIMDENAKMMSLIGDLNEKNELQTQLLTLLTQRVELLEKTFICDKLRRKKKKRSYYNFE